jgi:membrane-associated phospholipid phosphatase
VVPTLAARLALVALLSAGFARAEPRALHVDLRRDIAITAGAAAAAYGIGAMGSSSRCVICRSNGLDDAARGAFRLETPVGLRDAALASDWLVSLVLPAGALAASGLPALRDGSARLLLEDGIVIAQAALIAADLNALSKRSVGRARPSAAPGDASGRSFYSSHTSRAFTLAVATATVATMRRRKSAPWVWVGGLALASGVGYLRMASDSHWLTDVAAGAVIGSAVGFSVPWYLHGERRGRRLDVSPAPGGLAIAF